MFILYGRVKEAAGRMMAVMTTEDRDLADREVVAIATGYADCHVVETTDDATIARAEAEILELDDIEDMNFATGTHSVSCNNLYREGSGQRVCVCSKPVT